MLNGRHFRKHLKNCHGSFPAIVLSTASFTGTVGEWGWGEREDNKGSKILLFYFVFIYSVVINNKNETTHP